MLLSNQFVPLTQYLQSFNYQLSNKDLMKNRFIYIIILLNFPLSLISQNEISITNSDKKIILNKISELIKEQYVFPKKTERISQELLLRLKQGNYDTLNNYENFSNAIGRELRTISKDNHFNLAYFPKRTFEQKTT